MFPANAGVIPRREKNQLKKLNVPRKRGGDPALFGTGEYNADAFSDCFRLLLVLCQPENYICLNSRIFTMRL